MYKEIVCSQLQHRCDELQRRDKKFRVWNWCHTICVLSKQCLHLQFPLSKGCVSKRDTICVLSKSVCTSSSQFPLSKGCVCPESSTGSQLKESTANVLEPLLVQVEMKQEATFQLLHEQAVKWRPWSQNEAKIENDRSVPRTLWGKMLPKQNKETQITAIVDMLISTAYSRLNCTDCLEPLQLFVFLASFTELQSKHKTLQQIEQSFWGLQSWCSICNRFGCCYWNIVGKSLKAWQKQKQDTKLWNTHTAAYIISRKGMTTCWYTG